MKNVGIGRRCEASLIFFLWGEEISPAERVIMKVRAA
jgi:hypothetical protein